MIYIYIVCTVDNKYEGNLNLSIGLSDHVKWPSFDNTISQMVFFHAGIFWYTMYKLFTEE